MATSTYHAESAAASYFRHLPLTPIEARGVRVRDRGGRWLIDCLAAAGSMSLGWNHPVVNEAVRRTLASDAPLLSLDFPTPLRDRFFDELFACLPRGLADHGVVHLCPPSGAGAIEAALTVAEIATGGSQHVAAQGGFHGCSRAARSVSSGGELRQQRVVLGPIAHFIPYPQNYRCPFGVGGEAGQRLAIHAIDQMLTNPHSGLANPASVLVEFVLGEGGVIPAPAAWARALRARTRSAKIPLIADEIQSGVFRTGPAWSFEHSGIEPDLMIISKGLGSGFPIAVLVMRPEFNVWSPGAFTGTFRGGALAFAAAAAVLRFCREEDIARRVVTMGEHMHARLLEVELTARSIGEVRGLGLMLGTEIVDPDGSADTRGVRAPAPSLARRIQRSCYDKGLLVEVGGCYGNVVRFLPPLIIEAEDIERSVEIFGSAVLESERAYHPTLQSTDEPSPLDESDERTSHPHVS
jgi:diaminobutyrate-2-oxoglutarate transaminase